MCFVYTYWYILINDFEVQVSLRSTENTQRSLNKQEGLGNT